MRIMVSTTASFDCPRARASEHAASSRNPIWTIRISDLHFFPSITDWVMRENRGAAILDYGIMEYGFQELDPGTSKSHAPSD
jgi:hypothetical protein